MLIPMHASRRAPRKRPAQAGAPSRGRAEPGAARFFVCKKSQATRGLAPREIHQPAKLQAVGYEALRWFVASGEQPF
jgi:hypothetical protein